MKLAIGSLVNYFSDFFKIVSLAFATLKHFYIAMHLRDLL